MVWSLMSKSVSSIFENGLKSLDLHHESKKLYILFNTGKVLLLQTCFHPFSYQSLFYCLSRRQSNPDFN